MLQTFISVYVYIRTLGEKWFELKEIIFFGQS